MKQPHQGQFALYDVREDAAEQFKCANRLDATQVSPKAAASKAFGKYYGAVFRLGLKGGRTNHLGHPMDARRQKLEADLIRCGSRMG